MFLLKILLPRHSCRLSLIGDPWHLSTTWDLIPEIRRKADWWIFFGNLTENCPPNCLHRHFLSSDRSVRLWDRFGFTAGRRFKNCSFSKILIRAWKDRMKLLDSLILEARLRASFWELVLIFCPSFDWYHRKMVAEWGFHYSYQWVPLRRIYSVVLRPLYSDQGN